MCISMLNFRIVRGPLTDPENEAILREYNRLTSSNIPLNELVHWVRNGPAGPAWHAILETDEGKIVGHTSLFPLRTGFGGGELVPAKSEYSFLHEDYRGVKIRGFENAGKPAFIIILDRLFKHCVEQGWGPIFASTRERNQAFTRRVGLRPLEFPLCECLLALRPVSASQHTPNLTASQRAGLMGIGFLQALPWSLIGGMIPRPKGIRLVSVGDAPLQREGERISFFEDLDSLKWRYFDDQYVRFAFDSTPQDYLIAKRGSESRYLRVCQWRLSSTASIFQLLSAMVNLARRERAIGVRWAVYADDALSKRVVTQMRNAGFLCKKRVRTVMVHNTKPDFLAASKWNMNDSLFSFDP
jgi:hypothetical protein